jgi:hypothetical protein
MTIFEELEPLIDAAIASACALCIADEGVIERELLQTDR